MHGVPVTAKNVSSLRNERGLAVQYLGNKTSPGLSQQTEAVELLLG